MIQGAEEGYSKSLTIANEMWGAEVRWSALPNRVQTHASWQVWAGVLVTQEWKEICSTLIFIVLHLCFMLQNFIVGCTF